MNPNKRKAPVEIQDADIATIEAMHDLLLDHGHKLGERALRESRELTRRMYAALEEKQPFVQPSKKNQKKVA